METPQEKDQRCVEPWDAILATAIFTPSPHNAQPWRLRIADDRRATLFLERARMMPDLDVTGHFIRGSMGMFLEALTIASANGGYGLQYQLLDQPANQLFIPFAELQLQPGAAPSAYSDSLIRQRVTSRLGSNGVRMNPADTEFFRQFEPQHGQRYHQVDDPALIETLVEENIRAVFYDLNDRKYHDEISRWFRYSDAEARTTADGLDYRCMGLGKAELKVMKYWPQVMRWPVTRPFIRRMYRRQLGAFAHLGIISGLFFDDVGCMHASRYLLRFWLELARRNLYLHPLGNLVTNPQAKARLMNLTGIADPWLVFRIGYTAQPPRPYRRTVDEVLLHD